MQLGQIGLGRMGANIVRRLMKAGHECVVYDVFPDAVKTLEAAVLKAQSTDTLKIRAALQSGVTVHGAQGDFKILAGHHYPFKKVAIVTYKNGKQSLIKFTTPTNVPPA